jgi:hypothetical protein
VWMATEVSKQAEGWVLKKACQSTTKFPDYFGSKH